MHPTERFTGLATLYGQARPTYPVELVRWCLEQVPAPSLIVDLGCGTGISTRLFATTGHPVPPTRSYWPWHAGRAHG